MYNTCTLKKSIAGALLSGSVAVAGLGLGAGTAQANPGVWCPGQPLVNFVGWDRSVCHHYDINASGYVDLDTGVVYGWPGGPIRNTGPTPPPPPPPNIADQCRGAPIYLPGL